MYTVKIGDDLLIEMIEQTGKHTALDLSLYQVSASLYNIDVGIPVIDFYVDLLDQDYAKGRYNLILSNAQTNTLNDRLYCFDVKFTNTVTGKVHSSDTYQLNAISNYRRETFR